MKGSDCIPFLQWSLPQLRMRWNSYRRVRGQVCKRIDRRIHELGLADAAAYQSFLDQHGDEWSVLDSLCRVTISRFYRDREIFRALEQEVLVRLCEAAEERGDSALRCWSIGCASGEEPYTLALLWDRGPGRSYPSLKMTILASDADKSMIERARDGCYPPGSLRELPPEWKSSFIRQGERFCIRTEEREKVTFVEQDLRSAAPDGLFHIILCRNLAFTYFDRELQGEILARLSDKLSDRGALVLGIHEGLPPGASGFVPWPGCRGIYQKV